ncbi:DUF2867 domain-containing protein [uncultured Bacteroides sp.]|uniref:DUF2867 domain-containing protein n=1 Tax=uncultured Bacteroides sp. TaxID=162156 RepID=UPI002AA75704|nr:DUF2867 domain-containing protein [uncultured Bacteroides sp.]
MEKVDIAERSFIYDVCRKADYVECYQSKANKGTITLELCLSSFLVEPKWVTFLYKLRNTLVKPFGLETTTELNIDPNAQKGHNFGFFKVLERSEQEILLFANDKHLEAWFSLQHEANQEISVVKFATVVRFHNLMGKIYFSIIRPFHYLIIRNMLARVCEY